MCKREPCMLLRIRFELQWNITIMNYYFLLLKRSRACIFLIDFCCLLTSFWFSGKCFFPCKKSPRVDFFLPFFFLIDSNISFVKKKSDLISAPGTWLCLISQLRSHAGRVPGHNMKSKGALRVASGCGYLNTTARFIQGSAK